MLWSRVFTAALLLPLAIGGILGLPASSLLAVLGVIVFLGLYEWSDFCNFSWLQKGGYLTLGMLSLGCIAVLAQGTPLLFMGAFFWLLPLYWVVIYRPQQRVHWLHLRSVKACVGVWILVQAWYAVAVLRALPFGVYWILIVCLLIWSSDIFAYFIGKRWGRKPLALSISPGKTQAGLYGGVLGALLISCLIFYAFQWVSEKPRLLTPEHFFTWLGFSFFTVLLGVLGDLFESLMKRLAQVKDSGTLLPGHGGVLDRIDSMLAALPFYALCLSYFSRLS